MKLFTQPLDSCKTCPHCVWDGSPWSGKGTDGAMAARAAGVPAAQLKDYSSNAAFCKLSRQMLPVVRVPKTRLGIVIGTSTNATFVIPAHCKLPNA